MAVGQRPTPVGGDVPVVGVCPGCVSRGLLPGNRSSARKCLGVRSALGGRRFIPFAVERLAAFNRRPPHHRGHDSPHGARRVRHPAKLNGWRPAIDPWCARRERSHRQSTRHGYHHWDPVQFRWQQHECRRCERLAGKARPALIPLAATRAARRETASGQASPTRRSTAPRPPPRVGGTQVGQRPDHDVD